MPDELTSPRWSKERLVAAVECIVPFTAGNQRVCIGVTAAFPRVLPKVFLLDPPEDRFVPHVSRSSGDVCYQSPEGLSVLTAAPHTVVTEALGKAFKTLEGSLSNPCIDDIIGELPAYWRDPGAPEVRSFVRVDDPRVRIVRVRPGKPGRPFVVYDDERDTQGAVRGVRTESTRRGLYVPLSIAPDLAHTAVSELRRTISLRAFLAGHLDEARRAEFADVTTPRNNLYPLVVIGVPRRDGSMVLAACHFRPSAPNTKRRPFCFDADRGPADFLPVARFDRRARLMRGGAHESCTQRHVAVVGCGAVGAHVAMALAKAGVGRLTLIDPDRMSNDNVYRHLLGRPVVGKAKATALCAALRSDLPFLIVDAIDDDVFCAVERGKLRLDDLDLVVAAMGDATSHKLLNQRLQAAGLPAVHTWLEPLGIGGHAVFAGALGVPGCVDCLFTSHQAEELLYPRSSLAQDGQLFVREVAGCGSAHTPYGDLDARRTAQLASQLALDVLTERQSATCLRSWRGDATAFRAAGYETSPRFELSQDQLASVAIAHPNCPTCGHTDA